MEQLDVQSVENDSKECIILESHSGNCAVIIDHFQRCLVITVRD